MKGNKRKILMILIVYTITVMTPTKNEDMAEHQNEIYFAPK